MRFAAGLDSEMSKTDNIENVTEPLIWETVF